MAVRLAESAGPRVHRVRHVWRSRAAETPRPNDDYKWRPDEHDDVYRGERAHHRDGHAALREQGDTRPGTSVCEDGHRTELRATRRVPRREELIMSPTAKKSAASKPDVPASELIDKRISDLGDWRGEMLGRIRKAIKQADPNVIEEWKWMGTPVWSDNGIICTGETYKSIVKLTFANGASLKDPARLFNSSLDGNVRRAIDIHEGEELDERAFKDLIRAAVALNASKKKK